MNVLKQQLRKSSKAILNIRGELDEMKRFKSESYSQFMIATSYMELKSYVLVSLVIVIRTNRYRTLAITYWQGFELIIP